MGKIDIIIPVYNGEDFISEAIESILKQTYSEYKIIVVDDGSTDNSAEKVKEIQNTDSRIHLFQPGRLGLAKALNYGLEQSKAPFIAFLDADDLWESTKLEKQMEVLEKRKDISICFTKIKEFETFFQIEQKQQFAARKESMNGLVKTTFLGRREVFKKYGKFNPDIELGDFILWFSPLIHDGCRYEVIPEVLAYRRVHENNMTSKANRNDFLKILKAHLDLKKKNES